MSEKQTRQEIIDKRLKKAGWDVDNPSQVVSEHEVFHQIGTVSGVAFLIMFYWIRLVILLPL